MRTREEIKQALLDVLNHDSLDYIKADTGLSDKRCEEIYAIYRDLYDENDVDPIEEKNAYERYRPKTSPTTHIFCSKCGCKHDFHKMCITMQQTKT